MNIIKYTLWLLFFILSGCNETDVPLVTPSQAIRFSTRIQTLTTKSIITETALPDNSQIGVFSWGHHKNDGSINTTLRKDLTNTLYTKEAGSAELVTSADAHYPINPDTLLNFYAYYPYIQSATNTPGSIPFDLSKQEDIMWATPVLNRSKATNEETVNLSFNHLLSAITIKFKKADDIKEEMILESISLASYSPSLQLDIQTGKLTQTVSTTAYTFIKDLTTPVVPAGQTIVTDFLLYPIARPIFIVRMSGKDYRIESSKAFEPGKRQTYEFTLQAKDIHLSGSINPWVDGGSSNETVYF
ncbi:fimbrillin family protein [uncultured Parabacteroides sp.]|uniref:fimbrillin family protein n=1 Tax=uncultured Parabacteroides sp. TaxID=512312 RepID=UPI002659B1F6|nr:fimbrillin family protein [uncultured Parabacteroides sp.]